MKHAVRLLVVAFFMCFAGACAAETMTVREYSERWAHYYADVYRVPRELVEAVIQAESSWDPLAVSGKGAAGVMELMSQTGARFGLEKLFLLPPKHRGA